MSSSDWILLFGVPVGTAVLTLLANLYTSHKKFKAEVVSKSRIEWIQEARDLFVNFSKAGQELSMIYIDFAQKKIDIKEYVVALSNFKGYHNKIYLYFNSEDPDNVDIHRLTSKFYEEAVDFSRERFEQAGTTEDGMNKELLNYLEKYKRNEMELLKEVNFYLSNQWIRSKRLEIGNKTLRKRKVKVRHKTKEHPVKNNIHHVDVGEYI